MQANTGFFITLVFCIVFSISFIGFSGELNKVQSIDDVLERNVTPEDFIFKNNSYIYDANQNIVSEIYNTENRVVLPYQDIPPYFIQAMISTEDQHFYNHKGFDMNGIARAFLTNAEKQSIEQGGSTLTQQLVKNIYLSNERTYNRKLSELLYAYQLEQLFSKEKILELYLNKIYFQNGVYGIEAASHFYFSKSANKLSLSEVAFISAIPNNPTYYNPLINIENTNRRKEWILQKMNEMAFISEEQYSDAIKAPINLNVSKKVDRYPDYVTYIHYEFEQLVGEVEGFNDRIKQASTEEEKSKLMKTRRERTLSILSTGVHIYTALDTKKQTEILNTVNKRLPEKDIQASVVMIDHNRNQVVAISGGKNFNKFDFHRGFQAYRQPGSSIKPLLVFGPYISESRVGVSSPVNGQNFCVDNYCPQNYGGAKIGNVTLETALKHSYNTTAVRLMSKTGIDTSFLYLNQFDFQMIVEEDYRLPAALGGLTHGVSPLELTSAYTVFANNGEYTSPKAIVKVTDRNGNVLYEWKNEKKRVWDKETNNKMRTLLSKVVTEGTARKANISSAYVGGKTGTTNSYHDLWFVGLNETYTTGVWIGKDKPSSLANINNRSPHLLIWRDLMQKK